MPPEIIEASRADPGDIPTTTRPFARRTFLTLGLAALFVHGLKLQLPHLAAAEFNIVDFWHDPKSARAVGERYLAIAPHERDRALLQEAVFGAGPSGQPRSPEALRARISELREQDFIAGDTVLIDGWMMARTEARLCAMSVLV